jgi:ABC-type dipeptide/oligopeptide/nickel transport system ATPase component
MMMVLAAAFDPLIADHRLTGLDALEQAEALQLIEDPVDAGPAHATRAPAP